MEDGGGGARALLVWGAAGEVEGREGGVGEYDQGRTQYGQDWGGRRRGVGALGGEQQKNEQERLERAGAEGSGYRAEATGEGTKGIADAVAQDELVG